MLFRITLLPILLLAGSQILAASSATGSGNPDPLSERLAPCPSSPNCVSSQAKAGSQAIPPIPYTGFSEAVLKDLETVIKKMKRSRIVSKSSATLHAEFRTILGFVDDVEFLVDEERQVIHMRSASRFGFWDLGVNRRRLEAIRRELNGQSL